MPPTPSRSDTLDALDDGSFDVLVVGGGINGAVSAAALSARGAKVALIDRGDFAGFTSMHSSNLAWGGIKYMETWEFGLVRKLCRSRNELLRAYPSAVREVRFFTTITRGFRVGRWMLYLGTLLYWAIGGLFTRRPRLLSNALIEREEPNIDTTNTVGGVEYSDAHFVDNDAHFVFRFVRDAMERGAVVANYVESEGSTWDGEGWTTHVQDEVTGRRLTLRSRVVVNACGPGVEAHNERSGISANHRHVFSKGVHLIIDRVTTASRVLTFFASDGRLFFAIPMGRRSSIGTTDTRVDTLPPRVTAEDRAFILANINGQLRREPPLADDDIIAERCGVRPLAVEIADDGEQDADWTALSRKHVLEVDEQRPHLCIFGGKLTDCVNVGEEVVAAVQGLGVELQPVQGRWYGEAGRAERDAMMQRAQALGLHRRREPDDLEPVAERLWRRYGPRALNLLDAIEREPSLADPLFPGAEAIRVEAHHAAQHELVVCLDDFLRRRTRTAQVVRRQALEGIPELTQLSTILFGDAAQEQLAAYLRRELPWRTDPSAAPPPQARPAGATARSTSC